MTRAFVIMFAVMYSLVIINDLRNIATKQFPIQREAVTLPVLVKQVIIELCIVLWALACLASQ